MFHKYIVSHDYLNAKESGILITRVSGPYSNYLPDFLWDKCLFHKLSPMRSKVTFWSSPLHWLFLYFIKYPWATSSDRTGSQPSLPFIHHKEHGATLAIHSLILLKSIPSILSPFLPASFRLLSSLLWMFTSFCMEPSASNLPIPNNLFSDIRSEWSLKLKCDYGHSSASKKPKFSATNTAFSLKGIKDHLFWT